MADRWTETAREWLAPDPYPPDVESLASLLRDTVATAERERDEALEMARPIHEANLSSFFCRGCGHVEGPTSEDSFGYYILGGGSVSEPWHKTCAQAALSALSREREVRRGLVRAIKDYFERTDLTYAEERLRAALAAAAEIDREPKA